MPLIAPETGKFERPGMGKHLGTVIDVVDLGVVVPKNPNPAFPSSPQHRVQIVWILNTLGSDGKPLQYSEAPPFKMGAGGGKYKPTRLYEITSGILGQAPPVSYNIEELIGRSNELFIVKNGELVTIAGFLPVPPGVVPPTAPAGFVRKVNRPVAQPGQSNQQAQPAQPAQATQPAQPAQPAQPREVQF